LAQCFIGPKDKITEIFYFTAFVTWNQAKLTRHQNYVKALRFNNIKIVLGAFRRVDRICQKCNKQYRTFEEKRTDVNIAVKLFQTATNDIWDTALIISGDSDLIPAIESVKQTYLAKKLGVIIPIGRRAEELKQAADFHMKLKLKHLKSCQFDNTITINPNTILACPASWK